MRNTLLLIAAFLWAPIAAQGGAIYPIDRAHFLAGSRFDFKVEFDRVVPAGAAELTINGQPAAAFFGKPLQYVETRRAARSSLRPTAQAHASRRT